MATIIHANTGREAYPHVISKIRLFGVSRPSRNGPTRDLGHTTVVLDDVHQALPIATGRGLSEKIAAAEAIQLIGAIYDPVWLIKQAPPLSAYMEPSGEFWGAYGARVEVQVYEVIRKLQVDPWTRQAVIVLWDRFFDNIPDKRDYPCTVALGFTLVEQFSGRRQLDMNVTMRSNDAWLGLPYDMFQFTQLQHTVARVLGVATGVYRHTAWSMHLYETNLEESHHVSIGGRSSHFDPVGIGDAQCTYEEVARRARTIALFPDEIDWDLTPSERWYRDTLHR